MAWPSGLDYTETIQSPQVAFENPELRAAIPECRPPQSGIPYGRSGNFATVFRLQSPTGNWAVKCFTREPQDSKDRYAAISECLSKLHSPYMVDFTYLQHGIRIRGQWYPIVKMEWAEGDPLDVYVRKNLTNPQALANLALKWAQMIQTLERASVAHGDLQHGNILIVNSAIKLVDYDGMFVPSLAGRNSNELGQPNYQHPRRTKLDFGPYLDNFSAWVIYVTLVALSLYPKLWQTFQGGDDCLLFRKRDFEEPDQSGLLKALEHCQNQQLHDLVEFFKIALYSSPSDVPTFGNAPEMPAALETLEPPQGIPSWLHDHVSLKPPEQKQKEPYLIPADHSWVLDFVAPTGPPPTFTSNLVVPRILLYSALIVAVTAALLTSVSIALASVGFLIVNLIICIRRYKREPAVAFRVDSRMNVREADQALASVRKIIAEKETSKRAVRSGENDQATRLKNDIQNVLTDEKKQHEAVDRALRQATAAALQGKQRIDQQEAAELQQLPSTLGANASSLAQQINQSLQAETKERARALHKKQEEYVQSQLERVKIEGAIPGIGPYVTNNLAHERIYTAADCKRLTYTKVPSVGPRRVAVMLAWSKQLEAQARLTIPATLNTHEENTIKGKYAASRALLQSQLSTAQEALKTQQTAIKEKHSRSRAPFDSQIAAEKAKHSFEQQRIATETKQRQEVLQEAIRRANQKANEAIAEIEKDELRHREALKAAQWRFAKANAQNRRFERVSFGKYIQRIATGK